MTCLTAHSSRAQLEAALPGLQRRMLDGIEDYLFVGGDRMSARGAADRLGVNERTICRYRAVLRTAQGGGTQ
jgi:predicted DNA-binding transcriptional regulator YafY